MFEEYIKNEVAFLIGIPRLSVNPIPICMDPEIYTNMHKATDDMLFLDSIRTVFYGGTIIGSIIIIFAAINQRKGANDGYENLDIEARTYEGKLLAFLVCILFGFTLGIFVLSFNSFMNVYDSKNTLEMMT